MAKARRVRRCFHCGAILQTVNKSEPGFISEKIIESNKPDALLYCNRCYNKVKEINYSQLDSDVNYEIAKVLKDAVATDGLIIWVVDLWAFNGSINEDIAKKIKNNKVIVVGTKRDLFDKKLDNNQFIDYLSSAFKEYGIIPEEILIAGNEEDIDGKAALEKMDQLRQGHDVYMIGGLTSGKTVLINKILKSYVNKSKFAIRTEIYPGTETKVYTIPLSNSSNFYELPGFALSTSIVAKIDKDNLKIITPKKKTNIISKTLSKNECIVIGNLANYTLVKGKATPIKFYAAEGVEIKKLNNSDVDKFLRNNFKKRTYRPVCDNFSEFSDYDVFEYDMENDGLSHDISITGLCWISFISKGQTIRVYLPKGVGVKEHLSKIKF